MDGINEVVKEKLSEKNGFVHANNFALTKIDKLYCEMVGIITNSSLNPYNMAHGGYIFGLADTAGGVAASTLGKPCVTIDSNIQYLRPVINSKFIKAVATCEKAGKTIAVVVVDVYDDANKKVAKLTTNYFYKDKI